MTELTAKSETSFNVAEHNYYKYSSAELSKLPTSFMFSLRYFSSQSARDNIWDVIHDLLIHFLYMQSLMSAFKICLLMFFPFLGLGKTAPDPTATTTLDGVEVPLGNGISTGINDTCLLYNEYPLLSHCCALSVVDFSRLLLMLVRSFASVMISLFFFYNLFLSASVTVFKGGQFYSCHA